MMWRVCHILGLQYQCLLGLGFELPAWELACSTASSKGGGAGTMKEKWGPGRALRLQGVGQVAEEGEKRQRQGQQGAHMCTRAHMHTLAQPGVCQEAGV